MADWDESEHPRHPAKAPKGRGGEFAPKGAKVRDLATLKRPTLLKYARERGLVVPRGLPDDDLRGMIRRFDSGVEPDWIKRAGEQMKAKKAAKKGPRDDAQDAIESTLQKAADREQAAKLRRHAKVTRDLGHMRIANNPKGSYHHTRGQKDLQDADQMENEADRLDPPAHLREAAKKPPAKKAPAKRAAGKEPPVTVGVAFNSRKHPEGTRVVWHPEGEEPVYGTVGKMGRFTVVDWEGGNREKVRANVNHYDIRVVSGEGDLSGDAVAKLERKIEGLAGRLSRVREQRKNKGGRQRSSVEIGLEADLRDAKVELARAKREAAGGGWAERAGQGQDWASRVDQRLPFDFEALRPTSTLAPDEQARVRRLVRRDPQIYATVRDRYGRVSTSGNLSVEDAAWLEKAYRRDRAFVEYQAQIATIERDIRRKAKDAGQTPAQYRAEVAAKLKETLAGKPIAIRVPDESAVRDILGRGGFRTMHGGARRAPGLGTDLGHRRLGEQILGVPADTPSERRPVYGYVAIGGIEPALSAGRQIPGVRQREGQEDVLSAYGQIQVVLRPDLRARTTITVGDSLDEIAFIRPSPIDNPAAESGHGRLDWLDRPGFTRTGYVEAQVHGGVRTEDIAEVVFPRPPLGSTIAALDRRGIPWRVLPPGGDWVSRAAGQLATARGG